MNVVLFDIETEPNIGYTWGKWEQNVIDFVKEGGLLCYSYKVLGEKVVHFESKEHQSEKALVKKLHSLFSNAEILVAHNGDEFDIKKSNAFFIRDGLTPPNITKSIDTKKLAKKFFRFNSNKLDDLGEYLGLGRKVDTGGFDLWLGCMANERKSWRLMEKYNKMDVVLLEKIYNKLKSWNPNLINTALNSSLCASCGGKHFIKRGYAYSNNGNTKKRKVVCKDCGKWGTIKI
jgi:uncharacterized protein YprB with RNaseH-like and TPR domain